MVSFVGLGVTGEADNKKLVEGGTLACRLRHQSRTGERACLCRSRGSHFSQASRGDGDIVITMLPDSAEVEEVIPGESGVLNGQEGT